jgi:hypothetical protein
MTKTPTREHPAVAASRAAQAPRYEPSTEDQPMITHMLSIEQLAEAFDRHVVLIRELREENEALLRELRLLLLKGPTECM